MVCWSKSIRYLLLSLAQMDLREHLRFSEEPYKCIAVRNNQRKGRTYDFNANYVGTKKKGTFAAQGISVLAGGRFLSHRRD